LLERRFFTTQLPLDDFLPRSWLVQSFRPLRFGGVGCVAVAVRWNGETQSILRRENRPSHRKIVVMVQRGIAACVLAFAHRNLVGMPVTHVEDQERLGGRCLGPQRKKQTLCRNEQLQCATRVGRDNWVS